jgi:hypothetical protein
LTDRCDRAEEAANERVELNLKQKDEELLDIRAKCDDATARCAKADKVLEERGIVGRFSDLATLTTNAIFRLQNRIRSH